MGQIAHVVARPPSGLSIAETARRAGVSRSTLHRLMAGEVEASIETLRELAIVHGLDVAIDLVPLSDANAAVAARIALAGLADSSVDARSWLRRLRRTAGDDPIETLRVAGHAASVLHRVGAIGMRGSSEALRLASAGDASRGFWAVSGAAMTGLGGATRVPGPSILWTHDVDAAAKLLRETHTETTSLATAHVIVAPANPSIAVDAFVVDHVRYVAPIQMLLDCIGLGGRLEDWALQEAGGWAR